jgi:hypothetical protein
MKSFRGRWLFFFILIAGAGALLAFFLERRSSAAFTLSGAVRRPRETGPGRPIQMAFVRPGDLLLFRVSSRHTGYLAVVGIGGQTGRETAVYYPPAPIEAGEAIDLPSAIVADERVGNEIVYGFMCRKPVAITEISEQLTRSRGSASNYGLARGEGFDLPCEIAVLGFTKCEPDECP